MGKPAIKSTDRHGAGSSYPIGPALMEGGANFSLYSQNATGVDLLLFDEPGDIKPRHIIRLDPAKNHTYHYWHVFVPGIQQGQLYGYRVEGPDVPARGHRFDADKVLLDPYANAVSVPDGYLRSSGAKPGRTATPVMKSVVTDLTAFNWEGDLHPRRPFAQTVIYELHVGGFTKSISSGLAWDKRGTYLGLIEKIPYLVELGITAVELLPVFQFDRQDCPPGLVNYWGYGPVSFFAPHQGYATSGDPLNALNEFREMVKSLHRAGIEAILDVVFNHTAEGNHEGPTFSFRGIDNSTYYILEKDAARYANYSGTGNTLNANQPIVRRMILDALHFWVKDMHVDGFRFDLASILSRNEQGHPMENPPILWDIESDPVLAGTKLIAEAWDAAGLYQVGTFVGDSWKEWNGKFRDDVRSFLRGDNDTVTRLASRLLGSPDLYGHQEREPEQSINFVTCHDGFTLNDLVSYNQKHNEANGEENRDGENNNLSWNCGAEGLSGDLKIGTLRERQVKNFLTLTLVSLGAPMLLMGDEVRRTQNGNNNAYCQDNELSWFDWNQTRKETSLLRFVRQLIAARLQRDSASARFSMSLRQLLDQPLITWHGVKLNSPDWSSDSHTLAVTVQSLSGRVAVHYMINAYSESLDFEIPWGKGHPWMKWIDTARPSPDDICDWDKATPVKKGSYKVESHSVTVLVSLLDGNRGADGSSVK